MKPVTNYFYETIIDALGPLKERKGNIRENEIHCCCPFHDDNKPSFSINLHTGLYHCFTCGAKGNIVQFLSKMKNISISDAKDIVIKNVGFIDINQIPYSLEEFSKEKKLPIDFLEDNYIYGLNNLHVMFPYYDEEKNLVRVRIRNNPKSDLKNLWNAGNKTILYGLWHLIEFKKDYIILVEGETDSLSLWYHDIQALGVPGASTFKQEYAKIFKDFEKVIIHVEDDAGGKTFMKQICQSGIAFEKLYKVNSKNIDNNCKDPSDLHIEGLLDKDTLLEKIEKIDKDYFDEVNRGKQASKEHVIIAEKVLELLSIKYYNQNFYVYENGVYQEGLTKIEQCIISIDKNIKKSIRNEILDYLRITQDVSMIDIDKNLINFKNGIYHIDTNTLEPHSSNFFTICQINAKYLTDKELEELEQNNLNVPIKTFLNDISCGHTDRINTLLEFAGYSMTYTVELAKCLFLLGKSAGNGKSTFNKLLLQLIGKNNYCSISIEDFSERFYASELSNKLLNIVHEVKNTNVKDLSKFKSVISGDEISVEEKYKSRYTIKPFCHHIFAMNNMPKIFSEDEGFFRRLQIIPFEAKFTDEQQEKFNFDELITDTSLNYFANIALRKYLKMKNEHRRTFSNYKESNELVEEYRSGENSALLFINNFENFKKLIDKNNKIIKSKLYEAYENWCFNSQQELVSRTNFYNIVLASNQFKKAGSKNGYECFKYFSSR